MGQYYSLDKILKENADYNIIYGERSNGKTTAVLLYVVEKHIESNYLHQCALIRRWEIDFKGKNATQMLEGIVAMNVIPKLSKNKYNGVNYFSGKWYLCKYNADGKKVAQADLPFLIAFSIASEEHYKSTSYPYIQYVFFDEFITRGYYLPDEFVKFQNLLSTIIRLRDNVKIFMCGNTINKYNPYMIEMGLTKMKNQQPNTIDIYQYGDSKLKVAVELTASMGKSKKSNKYFAFDNPKLNMITEGGWEIDIYPHLPMKYNRKDVMLIYYIKFMDVILECSIIAVKDTTLNSFTYIHQKTTEITSDNRLIFTPEISPNPFYRRRINRPTDDAGKIIWSYFQQERVFYQNNEIGEVVKNYINWCKKE